MYLWKRRIHPLRHICVSQNLHTNRFFHYTSRKAKSKPDDSLNVAIYRLGFQDGILGMNVYLNYLVFQSLRMPLWRRNAEKKRRIRHAQYSRRRYNNKNTTKVIDLYEIHLTLSFIFHPEYLAINCCSWNDLNFLETNWAHGDKFFENIRTWYLIKRQWMDQMKCR